jgi:hypothetical protein
MAVLRLCVLAEGLPAGDDPVARVAAELSARHEVVVALTERRPAGEARLASARVVAIENAGDGFDAALACSWRTTVHLFGVGAARYVELVQVLDFEAMGAWQAERLAATVALDLPVDFIADPYVGDALRELRPDARVIDARLPFSPLEGAGPITTVLEGSPVPAMLAGSAPIVLPATAGPVEHMASGLVVEPEDEDDVQRAVDGLADDEPLRARLAQGALAAVEGWPSDAAEVVAALETIVAEPPPEAPRWPHRLMGDVMAAVAILRQDHYAASAHIDRLEKDEAVLAARRVLDKVENAPPGLRSIAKRAKKRLL